MVQEYLLIDENMKNKVEGFKPENVSVLIQKIDGSEAWVISFFAVGEKEETAKKLSSIHDTVVKLCENPIILMHGSSEYFNKKLFPLVNDFELNLRKLLYLYSALHKGEKSASNIKELEKKDFGVLFELLFTDDSFIKEAKTKANQTTWKYTKNELINMIKDIEEKVVWDELLGKDTIPTLRSGFADIRVYRNDVMHAHYMSYGTYAKAKKIYESVNKEINEKISTIINIKQPKNDNANEHNASSTTLSIAPDYNEILHRAMQVLDKNGYLRPYGTVSPDDLYKSDYQIYGSPLKASGVMLDSSDSGLKISPTLQSELVLLDKVKSDIPPVISELDALKHTLDVNGMTIPKEITELQKSLNDWQIIDSLILGTKK